MNEYMRPRPDVTEGQRDTLTHFPNACVAGDAVGFVLPHHDGVGVSGVGLDKCWDWEV